MKARLRTETQDVWQYLGLWYLHLMPRWVANCTEVREKELFLTRTSGDQLIDIGNWLVRDLDGEPIWYQDADFKFKYETVT